MAKIKSKHPLQNLYDSLVRVKEEQVFLLSNSEGTSQTDREAIVVVWNSIDTAALALHEAMKKSKKK
jgi:hypothetical protein